MRSGIDVEVGHRVRSVFAAILLAGTCACTGAPLALQAPTPSTAATSTLPLVVAGQSNAVNVAPFLREVYPQAVLSDSTQGAVRSLRGARTSSPLSCGRSSRTRYTSPCTPWSGGRAKAIARTPATSTTCASWSVRIRRENNNPALPIVVIRVLDLPSNCRRAVGPARLRRRRPERRARLERRSCLSGRDDRSPDRRRGTEKSRCASSSSLR